jgi:hypothetical protein
MGLLVTDAHRAAWCQEPQAQYMPCKKKEKEKSRMMIKAA